MLTHSSVVVAGADERDFDRPWHLVEGGQWNSEKRLLHVTWVDGEAATDLILDVDDQDVAAVLRERIESSLVHLEVEKLPDGGTLRGAIRRGSDGELFSQVSVRGKVRAGADLDHRVHVLEQRIRSAVGLPD